MKSAASLNPMALEQDQRIIEVVERDQPRLRNFIRRRVPDLRVDNRRPAHYHVDVWSQK